MFRHVSPVLLPPALAGLGVVLLVRAQVAGGAQGDEVGPLAVLRRVVDVVHGDRPAVRVQRLSRPAALLPALLALPPRLLLHLGCYLIPVSYTHLTLPTTP